MNAMEVVLEIAYMFQFKNNKIEPPEIYLGGGLENKNLNGLDVWMLKIGDYIKSIIANLEELLTNMGMKLPTKVTTPIINDYRPKFDETD